MKFIEEKWASLVQVYDDNGYWIGCYPKAFVRQWDDVYKAWVFYFEGKWLFMLRDGVERKAARGSES